MSTENGGASAPVDAFVSLPEGDDAYAMERLRTLMLRETRYGDCAAKWDRVSLGMLPEGGVTESPMPAPFVDNSRYPEHVRKLARSLAVTIGHLDQLIVVLDQAGIGISELLDTPQTPAQ